MKRRLFSLALVLCMVLTLMPVSAFASEAIDRGTCGKNLTWTLDDEGLLTISGEGVMNNYIWSYSSLSNALVTGAPWGNHYLDIKSVIIENGVTTIGNYAFLGCSSLTSVIIPDSVTTIGNYAFEDCSSLTSVSIPDSVTMIGSSAFLGCSSLTSVIIPDGVTTIGSSVFEGCSSLTSVIIPDSVTTIGSSVFEDCSSLTSVIIPDSVTMIGSSAFLGCSSLTSVIIPDGVTTIEDSVFYGCSSLTSISIPDGATTIGDGAFYGCSSLTSVIIPDGVATIGYGAFRGCSSLTSVIIPDSVTTIGNYAFKDCSRLTSIIIPDGVTTIGDSVFKGCSRLTSVIIPDGVTTIGDSAFYGCSSLTSISIPDGVTTIGDYAFWGCGSLTSVIIPDGVTTIGDSAFRGCSSLTSIIIPDGVTTIGDYAFWGCGSLTSVIIPDGVTTIGDSAFDYCYGIKDVAFGGTETEWRAIGYSFNNNSPNIHYNCTLLEDHYIPIEIVEATCTSTGHITYCCNCGYEHTEITPQKHDYKLAGTIDPTCSSHGYDLFKCSKCGGTKTEYHEDEMLPHSYEETVVEPTCLAGGYTMHKCLACGASYKDNIISPLGHIEIEVETQAATCTEEGCTAGIKCERCGKIISGFDGIPTLGHDYGEWSVTTAPTCTEKGVETRYCSRCAVTETRKVKALGHDLVHHDSKSASCTEKGWEAYDTCSRCDYTTYKEIPATGHSYKAVVTDPTCTEKGYTTHTCACGDTYVDTYVEALGHKTVLQNAKLATCTETGYSGDYICTICGETVKSGNEIKAIGHNFGEWTVTTAPTCIEKGVEMCHCSRCDATETREVKALGHDLVHHDSKSASCIEKGWEAYDTCSRCDYTTYKEIPATGHSYKAVVTAPTCAEKGYTTYTCACGDSYVADYKDALGHDFGEWQVTTAPTCTEKGVETRYCSRCAATETREIEALGHDLVHHDGKAVSCTEKGWEAYDTCSRCDYTTYKEIPATGHSYTTVVTEPTCTEKGYTTHTCACGNSYVDSYVDVIGHSYKNGKCTRCGAKDPTPIANPFKDVKNGQYYYEPVLWAVQNDITKGTSATTFSPNATCTRGQTVTFLWRAMGSPEVSGVTNPFVDVKPSDYFYKAVLWAVKAGVTQGVDPTHFGPNKTVTRGQTVTFLWRAAGQEKVSGANIFSDVNPSDYYYNAVLWAVKNGITNGMTATTFSPNSGCTRGQIVTFLYRYIEK